MLPLLNENFVRKNDYGATYETYSAEIRYAYTVNKNGMCNRTKHFFVWNTPNKSCCAHRKTLA